MRWAQRFVPLLLLGSATAAEPSREATPISGDTGLLRPDADGIDFAAAARIRFEYPERKLLEPESADQALSLLRVVGSIDAHHGPVAGFVQLSAHRATDDRGNPVKSNAADVQQAYVDLTFDREGNDRLTRVRVGRAEMTHEFVALRDAPNVRRTWDGARLTVVRPTWTANAFATRVVMPEIDAFDDSSADGDRLLGMHVRVEPGTAVPFGLRAWFYRARQDGVEFLAGHGQADTKFAAVSLDFDASGLEASVGGGLQWGRFAALDIDAHFIEAELGRSWSRRARPIRLAMRYSAFSGGDTSAEKLRTFNPLFPNFAYSTEAALQSPSNLIKAALLAQVSAREDVTLEYRGEGLWRYSAADAFYTPVGFPLIPPDESSDRSLGVQQQIKVTWKASAQLTFSGAVVHFAPRSFLGRAGMSDGFFGMLQLESRF